MNASQADPSLAAFELVPPIELFALRSQGRNNRTVGVRTGAGNYVYKTYLLQSDPEAILYEHRLLTWLANTGLRFAVPVPVKSRHGKTLVRAPEGWKTLTAELPGQAVVTERVDQVEAMGVALGELHVALSHYPAEMRPGLPPFGEFELSRPLLPDLSSLQPEHLGWPNNVTSFELLSWWRDELNQVRAFADSAYRSLPRQVVHRDFDPSNTLISAEQIVGVLDFEYAGLDVRALDVAGALKYTMRVWENHIPWETARVFCRGYGRVNTLTEAEVSVLPWLTRLRDSTSMDLRLARALAAGNTTTLLNRVQEMKASALWLEQNGQLLVDTAHREFHRE